MGIRSSSFDQVYNVRNYGALGDGSTDDTVAIQAAINACGTAGGGIVFFSAGSYKITAALIITSDYVTLQGVGSASRIFTTSTTINLLDVGTMSTSTKISRPKLEKLKLEHASGTGTGGISTVYTLRCFGVSKLGIKDCWVQNGGTVFYMQNSDLFEIEGTDFEASSNSVQVSKLVQGVTDDVTIGVFKRTYFNTKAANQICMLFDESGNANEFNRLSFIVCKFGGTSGLSGNTGIKVVAGVRGTTFLNCAFQYNTNAQFDFSGYDPSNNGYKTFITIDQCSLIGTSGTKVLDCIKSANDNDIYIVMNNCSVQTTTDIFDISTGSANFHITNIDASVDNVINCSGGTPRFNFTGVQRWGTITNKITGAGNPVINSPGSVGSFITEAKGTSAISAGTTSVAITFSTALDVTPVEYDVTITSKDDRMVNNWYISAISATGMTVNVTTAPLTTNWDFAYKVKI